MVVTSRYRILLIGLMFWTICIPLASAADSSSEPDVYEMEELVVSATRAETPEYSVSSDITVVTRDEMDQMPVANVAEVIQYIPGVYVEFAGGPGSQAVVRIQGSETRHVAVYQDGIPLNQLANPLTDLSYLPVDSIDRIEVSKGISSAAWGSALGGVINIITREPDPGRAFSADIHASYGEFQTLKSRGSFSGEKDRFSYFVSLTHDESGGFIQHTGYEQNAVYGKIGFDMGDTGHLRFVYSYDEGRNDDPLPQFPPFWDDIYRKRIYQHLLFEISPTDDLFLSLEGRHHRFTSKIEDVFQDHREIYNDYEDRIYGISGRLSWRTGAANVLNVGFDQDWGRYNWINYDREYDTRNAAMYANDTLIFGSLSLNAGLRYDDNCDFGTEISPSVGAVYRIRGNKALVRGQVAKGFSAPPAAWVHDPVYGNAALKPEIGVNYQLSGRLKPFPFLSLELSLFQAEIEQLINFDFGTMKFENLEEVTRKGLEGSLRLSLDFGLTMTFGATFVDIEDGITGEEITNIPTTTYHVTAVYTNEWMTHSLLGKHIDHNSTFPETRDQVFVFDYRFKANLPLPQRYDGVSVYAAVYNLADADYLYRQVWPQPGRWFEGGISFDF